MTPPTTNHGLIATQIHRLVTLAEQEEGYRRRDAIDKIGSLIESDAAHLMAIAELVRATTEAHTLGVPLEAALSATSWSEPPARWWQNWPAVAAAAASYVASMAILAAVIA